MDRVIALLAAFFVPIRLWLETNLGVGAAFATLCLVVFLFVYAFRKLFPNGWIWLVKRVPYIDFEETPVRAFLDKTLQALPGTLFGAVVTWVSSGGQLNWAGLKVALLGALAGPLMAVGHHVLSALPWIPYLGRLGSKAKRRFTPPEGTRSPESKS